MATLEARVLFLTLTFATFLLFELVNGLRLHPLQYLFVGLALCLFYLLLVSLSEQVGFGLAYLVSSRATVLLIAGYSAAILVRKSRAGVIGGVLAAPSVPPRFVVPPPPVARG